MQHNQKNQYREITALGVGLGILQGIVMTAAFVYAGLKLGFGIGGSTIAAIMGFAVLKGIFGKGTIPENNINQTIASGINVAGSGIIFTLPALYLMGKLGQDLNSDLRTLGLITLAATAGSFIGVAVIIPLRKQMVDFERLRFPSGTAVSVILKSPGAGAKKALLTVAGTLISALFAILVITGVLPEDLPIGDIMGLPEYTQTAIYLSLMNLGAGLLAGAGGIGFAMGGIIAYWILAPLVVQMGWVTPPDGLAVAEAATHMKNAVYGGMLRPMGIGMLIGGALMGAVIALPVLKSVFKSLAEAAKTVKEGGTSEEMPIKTIWFALAAAFFFLLGTCLFIEEDISVLHAVGIASASLVYILLAGLIVAQCTGTTDTSPLSGLSLIAVTMVLFLSGNHILITVLIGVTVCVATGQCADMMQDLKTGFLVGSRPIKQQIVQLCVAWIGPSVAVGTVVLLWKYGSGSPGFGPGTQLIAPQAMALQSMIDGVVNGDAPTKIYAAGGVLGGILSLLPGGGLGVLIGLSMYLPFSITLGYGIGCVGSSIIGKIKGADWCEDNLTPFAAGLIVGEALIGLGHAVVEMFRGQSMETQLQIKEGLGYLFFIAVILILIALVIKKIMSTEWLFFSISFVIAAVSGLQVIEGASAPNLFLFIPASAVCAFLAWQISHPPRKKASPVSVSQPQKKEHDPDYYLSHINSCFESREMDLITIEEVQNLCLRMSAERFRYMRDHGIEPFAAYFEPFSTAERHTNRAWSSLVDGYHEESRECWENARLGFQQATLAWEEVRTKIS